MQILQRSFRASTVMSSMKLPRGKFRAMANLMLNDVKLKVIIDSFGISTRTAYVWRMKVYAVAFEIQKKTMLSGKCWIYAAWMAFKTSVREGGIGGKDRPSGIVLLPDEGRFQGKGQIPRGLASNVFVDCPIVYLFPSFSLQTINHNSFQQGI